MTATPTLALESGDEIPLIGLGTWKADPGVVKSAVKTSISLGYRHIDCAAAYGNEKEVGEAIAECINEGVVKREELWVTSKLWCDSLQAEYVIEALEKTLSDLRLEYLDLYLIHWPIAIKRGDFFFPERADQMLPLSECPIAKTWEQLETAVDRSLVRNIGVSNFSEKKLRELLQSARITPAVNQIERHPYLQQTDMFNYCKEHKIHLTGYSPLGSGDFSGRSSKLNLMEDPVIVDISKKRGCTPAQVLIKWAVDMGTSVAPKSTNKDRLAQNLASAEVQLDDGDMEKLSQLDRHLRFLDATFWCVEDGPYTLDNIWDEQ